MEEIITKIKVIIEEVNPYVELTEEMNLLEEGVIDSLAIFAIVTEIENEFNLEVPDDMITKENFETVQVIAETVQRLTME